MGKRIVLFPSLWIVGFKQNLLFVNMITVKKIYIFSYLQFAYFDSKEQDKLFSRYSHYHFTILSLFFYGNIYVMTFHCCDNYST